MLIILSIYLLSPLISAEISPIKLARDDEDTIVISIKDGEIRGNIFQTVELENPYYAFRGIPYAEPPIGDLRFEPPVPVASWQDVKNTTEDPETCFQSSPLPSGSEDCLFLSVYAPASPTTELLPVMVWIPGGAFLGGNIRYGENAPDFIVDQNVVVVIVQYRLGIFGFLSTGDMVLPGNGGLKDQLLALKWVKNNIGYFGGDSGNVTLAGQSAGSASVSYLVQSKIAEGLFHRTILQSGTSLCTWAFSRYPKNAAIRVAQELNLRNVNPLDSVSLVEGLKEIDGWVLQWISIVLTGIYLLEDVNNGFYFSPVIEPNHPEAVFTEQSYGLLQNGEFNKVPTIIGFNSQEGILYSTEIVNLVASLYEIDISRFPPASLHISDLEVAKEVGLKIHDFYWGNSSILSAPQINTTQYISDHEFVRPIHKTVSLQSSHVPVYYYKFSHDGLLSGHGDRPIPGVSHGEETSYLFRKDRDSTESDRAVRSWMVKMWTNFIKFNNPTPENDELLGNLTWPVANESGDGSLTYLEFLDELVVGQNPNQDNVEFWEDVYDRYGEPPFDTY